MYGWDSIHVFVHLTSMASRRSRIKGIANIPQRRKAGSDQQMQDERGFEGNAQLNLTSKHTEGVTDEPAVRTVINVKVDTDSKSVHNGEQCECKSGIENLFTNGELQNHIKVEQNNDTVYSEKRYQKSPETKISAIITNSSVTSSENEKLDDSTLPTEKTVKSVIKRHFIKPTVSSSVLQKHFKTTVKDELKSIDQPTTESLTQAVRRDIVKSVHFVLDKDTEIEIGRGSNKENLTISESHVANDKVTYPPPPTSPSKLNRGRIKVAPRLGQRRTSFSASESEDDGKKSSRHRNDSVCSTTSGTVDQSYLSDCPHSPKKEFASVVQRKFRRTEQSRKMAEARREFQMKCGSAVPDRQKLTMKDLIFYNPTTNPMSQKGKLNKTEAPHEQPVENEKTVEERNAIMSEEESEAFPAPQIKIGPDGEITIDEKSLVIENKQLNKSREKIQKSEVVDGNSSTTYGIYKKLKRPKLWSKKETLRFYRALNAIGTDFSLMVQLFPGRTRRDLTMKFKREEKLNMALVNKALMEPSSYDITKIQKEVELDKREEREREKVEMELEEKTKKRADEKQKKKEEKGKMTASKRKLNPTKNLYKDLNKGVNSFLDDSDADDELDTYSQTVKAVSEMSESKSLRPRKYRKIYTDPEESDENEKGEIVERSELTEEKEMIEKCATNIAVEKTLEPGSVLIYSSEGPNGNPVYKFFMVTPVQGNAVDIQDAKRKVLNIGTVRIEDNITIPMEENNMTIPAQENTVKNDKCIVHQNIVLERASTEMKENHADVLIDEIDAINETMQDVPSKN